ALTGPEQTTRFAGGSDFRTVLILPAIGKGLIAGCFGKTFKRTGEGTLLCIPSFVCSKYIWCSISGENMDSWRMLLSGLT
ncbi:hypothetical protein, partial [Desulfovibrio sp.]|uniref:hypothetical protein n=1 Tax=Desulfovibrio sp. TaxID=885 RepID=UPI0030773002